jgi:hypothetical protein
MRIVRFGIAFAAAALAGMGAALALSQERRGDAGGDLAAAACVAYEHSDFQGEALRFRRGEEIASIGQAWNDRISSIRCRPNCNLEAFEHVNFQGARIEFAGEASRVPLGWNDRISALRVNCSSRSDQSGRRDAPACVYYEHANFTGRQEVVADGEAIPSIGAAWNDRISSIRCRPGCSATGFEHVDFRGGHQTFEGETRFVGAFWNDRISALRAQCR